MTNNDCSEKHFKSVILRVLRTPFPIDFKGRQELILAQELPKITFSPDI